MRITESLILAILGSCHVTEALSVPFRGSAYSWSKGQIDLFGVGPGRDTQVWHKVYDDAKKTWKTEKLNLYLPERTFHPVAVSRAKDRIDVVSNYGGLFYQTWNGTGWSPEGDLNDDDNPAFLSEDGLGVPSVVASAPDRLDIITRTYDGQFARKYFNGSAWLPEKQDLEYLCSEDEFSGGVYFASDPATVSWEKNSFDVFGVLGNGTLLHKYWNGQAWKPSTQGWQNWGDGFAAATPVVISRADKTLEIFAWKQPYHGLPLFQTWYTKWDSSKRLAWDNIGGYSTLASDGGGVIRPTITYQDDRIDLFDFSGWQGFHKYYENGKWHPKNETEGDQSYPDWNDHNITTTVRSGLVSTSWGKNNINLFYYDEEQQLRWQQYNDGAWTPSDGGSLKVTDTSKLSFGGSSLREQMREAARLQAAEKAACSGPLSRVMRPLVDQTRSEHMAL